MHPPGRLEGYIACWVEGCTGRTAQAVRKFPLESGGYTYSYEAERVVLRHRELFVIQALNYVAGHCPPRRRSQGYLAVWIQSQEGAIIVGNAEGCLKAERVRICIAFQLSARIS